MDATGQELRRALSEHTERLEAKIRELQSELQDAKKKERETPQELEEEARRLWES